MPTDPSFKKAQEHLDQAAESAKLSGRVASDADIVRMNRAFGKDDKAFAEAAIAAVAGCPDAYSGVAVSAAGIKLKVTRLDDLRDLKGAIDALGQQVGQEISALRVEIGGDVQLVQQAADAVELHPGTDPALKKRAARAAQHLRSLGEARKDEVRSALAQTRAQNSKVTSKEEEKAALASEVEKLRLQNKYLAGEDLVPGDLPPAPAGRRAAPAPATPARARRRSKR